MRNALVKNTLLAAAAVYMLTAAPAIAHHGTTAHFDHDKDITVVGVVSEMRFVNPHSYLYFDVLSDSGEVVPWRCEMVEAGTLRRAGLTAEILTPGTIVRVKGKPARRENAVCYLETMTLTDGTTISHRGQMAQGGEGFTPPEALKGITATSSSKDTPTLASGGDDAANRKIVPVPTEGFFGYWSDGTRSSLAANTGNRARGQGQRQARANGAMAGGGTNRASAGGGMAARAAGAGEGTTARAMGGGRTAANGGGNRNPNVQYNAEGKALEERYDARYDNPALACSASVLFGMGHHSLSNEFVQLSDTELRLTYGYMDMVRTIHVDSDFPRDITPSVSGYSVGTWEDDTLIVKTKGFLPGVLFAFAGGGEGLSTLNSDQLEVTERFTHDAATDTLSLKWTANDPGYWTGPLSGERTLNRSVPYEVYGCVELAGANNIRENGESLFVTPTSANAGSLNPVPANYGREKPIVKALLIAAALLLILGGLAGFLYSKSPKRQK